MEKQLLTRVPQSRVETSAKISLWCLDARVLIPSKQGVYYWLCLCARVRDSNFWYTASMKIFNKVAKFFGLNDETWIQHANPWSVWSRMCILPLLAVAVWSHVWIGWYSLYFIGAIIFWTWINPRFFGKPKTTKHWASKAVFGERVWLRKDELSIPTQHLRVIFILNIITGSGLPFLVWGLYELTIWSVILGITLVILGKMWFLDRMVWLYEDMKHKSEEYLSWEY